jgi:hypothetical protein
MKKMPDSFSRLKKIVIKLAALIFLSSCSSNFGINAFEKKSIPYALNAKMVTEASNIYEMAGIDFSFYNRDSKPVKSFTMVFFMYDEDGNPPGIGNNGVKLEIDVDVAAGECEEDIICIDRFMYEIPDSPYQLDYLYVSRIVYADGSEWSDPFGMYAIN